MGQAKNRGTFEERKAAAIIVNDEKQRLEAVAKSERIARREKHRIHTRDNPRPASRGPSMGVITLGLMGGLYPK